MASGLASRGIYVKLLARSARRNIPVQGAELEHLSLRFPYDLAAVRLIRRTVIEGGFDIVHIFTSRACLPTLLALWGIRRPKVFWFRGAILKISKVNPLDRLRYFGKRIDCFIAVSDAVRRSLIAAGVEPARTETIYDAHAPNWYKGEQIDLRKRLGISPDVFVAGTIANVRKVKGLQYLIRSAALIRAASRRFAIVIVGRDRHGCLPREVSELHWTAQSEGCRVYLTGEIPNAFRALRSFDCFVMPSLQEGLGKAVIEAMSQELPVVATRVGGLLEVVEHEKTGLLIPPRSPGAIANAVMRLADEPQLRERIGRAAKHAVAERFAVENMVEKTIRTYERFLGFGATMSQR